MRLVLLWICGHLCMVPLCYPGTYPLSPLKLITFFKLDVLLILTFFPRATFVTRSVKPARSTRAVWETYVETSLPLFSALCALYTKKHKSLTMSSGL